MNLVVNRKSNNLKKKPCKAKTVTCSNSGHLTSSHLLSSPRENTRSPCIGDLILKLLDCFENRIHDNYLIPNTFVFHTKRCQIKYNA